MTLKQALLLSRGRLAALKDVEDPSFESEVLLRNVLKISRAQLFLDTEKELNPEKEKLFFEWVERRLKGEPTAYIIQYREFFGLDFYVDSRVLIPRPETELLVEEAIHFSLEQEVNTAADIGTGSGAIAVSLATYLQQIKIYATDISASALEVAEINCRKHGLTGRVVLLQGDLLEPLPKPVDILIANLPYVQKADIAHMPSAKYEPVLALDGGESGLDQIFRICRQVDSKIRPNGLLLLEIGQGQEKPVINTLRDLFPSAEIETKRDLSGIERVVKVLIK